MKVNFADHIPTLAEFCKLCGGKFAATYPDNLLNSKICGVCTDSREAGEGIAFVAIRGEKVDGHSFVATAARLGAVCAICDHVPMICGDIPLVIVQDTVKAIGCLGYEYTKDHTATRIGVTGSVGKTTTKEFIAAVLAGSGKVWKTEGNYNSVIGMPLSLIGMPRDAEYAVLEMGMGGAGQIERLSRIAKPDIAVITTIGTSHMEALGSRENIAKAKLEIKAALSENGKLILCGGEPLLSNEWKRDGRVSYFSVDDRSSDYYAYNILADEAGMTFDVSCRGKLLYDLEIPVIGKHNVSAALAAIAVAHTIGLDDELIRRGIAAYRPVALRQQMLDCRGVRIICDCYNASPESMRAAGDVLRSVATIRSGKTIALLGDMLELGGESVQLHHAVGEYFAKNCVDYLVTFGERALEIANGAREYMSEDKIFTFPDHSDAAAPAKKLSELLGDGDTLLIKASRLIAAERVADELKKILDN